MPVSAVKTVPSPSSGVASDASLHTKEPVFRDFYWQNNEEPHASRRKQILEKHPEIRDLFGEEPLTFPIVVAVVLGQIALAYWASQAHWGLLLLVAYVVGATANHSMFMAMHELSHNMCFQTVTFNRLLATFASLPTIFPSATSFRRYHMEHHQYQGTDGIDVDVPSTFEINLFMNSTIRKFFFVFFQGVFYSIRPLLIRPLPPTKWDAFDLICAISFDYVVFQYVGWQGMAYLLFSTLFGMGLHPSAGHFIAEHYVFVKGIETYSYYGPMNFFNFNVGYHNEHHDFPRVPWSRLPMITKIAPEFYKDLPRYDSYIKVIYNYITDPTIGPYSRVKRPPKKSS